MAARLEIAEIVTPKSLAATPGEIAGGGNDSYPTWDFDPAVDTILDYHGRVSDDYAGGDIDVDIVWQHDAGTGNAYWTAGLRRVDDDSVNVLDPFTFTFAPPVVAAAPSAVGRSRYTTITCDAASRDGLQAGERFVLRLRRASTDPFDTLTSSDARVIGLSGSEA